MVLKGWLSEAAGRAGVRFGRMIGTSRFKLKIFFNSISRAKPGGLANFVWKPNYKNVSLYVMMMFFVGCVRHSYLPPFEADADRQVHMRVYRVLTQLHESNDLQCEVLLSWRANFKPWQYYMPRYKSQQVTLLLGLQDSSSTCLQCKYFLHTTDE